MINIFKKKVASVKKSYSQCGEDIIVDFIREALKINTFSYLDIGANDPITINNTYLFYRKGFKGVCVEPDPILYDRLRRVRKGDVCLNAGIGTKAEKEADFYMMTVSTLNTFSKAEAERYQSYGNYKIEKTMKVPLISINGVIDQYLTPYPNFVSLDIEGLDFEIMETFDFSRFRPEIFCIETLTYTADNTEKKIKKLVDFVTDNGYMLYADTYINSIFVEKNIWKNR